MDKEKADNMHPKSSCPVPTGLPINWGLITGPVPEPVFSAYSLNTSPPPTSAVHTLQTKVKSLTQRRTRGRERDKDREKVEAEVQVSGPPGQTASGLFLRQRPRGKGQLSVPSNSWRSGSAKDLSSSDDEEEVEVQVRLEIHSPPVEMQREQGGEEDEEKKTEENEAQFSPLIEKPCGLREGTSLESLLLDSKDDPSPPTPPAEISSSLGPTSNMSSSSVRPPKGFWRVARPETLLLNGVGPHNIPPTLPVKDYTQLEVQAEPERKSKPSEPGSRNELESAAGDTDVSSQMQHSDSAEFYLDRGEPREEDVADSAKGECSSDSWESASPQGGGICADLKLRVKERAYAKLRERQQNCMKKQEQSGGESVDLYKDITYRVDYKGTSLNSYLVSHESLCHIINTTK